MTDTPLDLDVIEAHHRRTWRGDDMVPTCSCGAGVTPCTTARLVAALRRAEAQVDAVLALCDDMDQHAGEATAYDGVDRVARLTTDSIRAAVDGA